MQGHFRVWLHSLTEGGQYQQKKMWKQREKNNFQEETFIRLSPMSKCYCFNHSRASRIQKFFLPAYTFQCSMAPPL